MKIKLIKQMRRFSHILLIFLVLAFIPLRTSATYMIGKRPNNYPVNYSTGVTPGRYRLQLQEGKGLATYIIYPTYLNHFDEIIDNGLVEDGDEIVLYDGEYVSLKNCTAKLIEAFDKDDSPKRARKETGDRNSYSILKSHYVGRE